MRNYLGAAAAGLLVIALIWLLVSRNNDEAVDQSVRNVRSPASQNVGDHKYPDKAGVHISSITPESGEIGESIQSTNLEPIDIREWRMSHGYYRSDSNDSGSKHPYEYYNIETLEKLAQNGDGLAQIMLGEKLAFSAEHQERSRELYWQAAINGFTAGLSNTATDSMVLKAGSTSFDFPTNNEEGDISDEFVDRLKYLAAAEYLGDFVASQLLRDYLDSFGLGGSSASRNRICQSGLELSERIQTERFKKSGGSISPADSVVSLQMPEPYCST